MVNKITKGVILASGNGTRSRPLTYYIPKPMMPLGNMPMAKKIAYQMINAGIKDILVVSRNDKEGIKTFNMLIDYFSREKVAGNLFEYKNEIEAGKITFSVDFQPVDVKTQNPLGTAIGLKVAYDNGFLRDEPCVTMFSDVILQNVNDGRRSMLEDMLSKYNGDTLVSIKRNNLERLSKKSAAYGRKICENIYRLDRIVEKPPIEEVQRNPTELSVGGGIYILNEDAQNKINRVKKGAGGEYHITDLIDMQAREGNTLGYLIDTNSFKHYDVGEFDVFIRENLEEKYKKGFFDYVKNSADAVKSILIGGVALYGGRNDLNELLSFLS